MSTQKPSPVHLQQSKDQDVVINQPAKFEPMLMSLDPDNKLPYDENKPRLRGGRSELCPGRFCFIIPCPLPCDFCII